MIVWSGVMIHYGTGCGFGSAIGIELIDHGCGHRDRMDVIIEMNEYGLIWYELIMNNENEKMKWDWSQQSVRCCWMCINRNWLMDMILMNGSMFCGCICMQRGWRLVLVLYQLFNVWLMYGACCVDVCELMSVVWCLLFSSFVNYCCFLNEFYVDLTPYNWGLNLTLYKELL